MAALPVRTFPDPVLRQKAKRVPVIDEGIQRLVDAMIDTMDHAEGVGLAAPQVGVSLRIIVIGIPEEEEVRVLINPEFIKREGERIVSEGCLSIPEYRGELKRAQRVKVKALDRQGKQVRITAEDLLAQALEHEIDHLNGVLYIDLLESPDKLFKLEEGSAEEVASLRMTAATPAR